MQRKGTILTVAALSLLTLAGCGSQSSSSNNSGKYAAKQVLNWTESSELATTDLAQATDTLSFNVLQNTQEGLYRLNSKGTPAKALATSTKVTNGGKTYTFNLRHGVKWSNGDPVTAKDFVYSWQRTVSPKTASQDAFYLYQVKNAEAVNKGKKSLSALGIKATGKYTLTVNLTKPVSYFKKLLAWPLFYPVNQNAVNKYGKKYGTSSSTTVYNGPYRLTKWNGTSKSWTLAKNKTHWDKKAVHLTKINEQVTESTTTSYNLYNAKKVDETLLSGQQIKNNKNSKDFVKRLPTGSQRLDLNEKKVSAFKNVNIRKALSLAINRTQLVNDVLQDGSVASKGFVPAGMGNNPKTGEAFNQEASIKSAVSYNVKQAKTLLAKGLKQTGDKKLNVTLSVSDTDSSKQTAEFIQSSLEKLPNVTVTIKTVPYVQLITQQNNGNYELTLAGWQSVFADPINFLDVFEADSSYNTTGWKNSTYDKLLDEAENVYGNQPEKRWGKLVAAEQVLMKNQGTIPLYQAAKSQLLRSNVKSVVYNPAGVPYDWKTTYIAK
ncbi:peptide ABC transporter substrate-binding protein [Levilactobacillus brevis]|uniref:peptide ABC transporter substrate-binding protein n=1 Tax=Levilactobacillus brevis TaxID=1580 RepID=UPI000BE90F9C|nr:peptide ABC transporter substrate-binding protein [Levilactobacillus brevis]MCZ2118984.1 peptide ABC transporter substrate-binding protein [Levilactobacillus brevis]MCZ2124375.1 peptide ABC transporter substrate-binding protein [Levilactobacillus brevis]MCZ2208791.1 peptide ABC transporter substrate-binding protein [Levilactobacillus brevis]MCZ2324158.1 peptide ABC transporter substrate-binding protein [Levilactobacillus brevis]